MSGRESAMTKQNNSSSTPALPDDLVLELLLLLPVKSVVRFSCVSKSWNQLISSHEFCNQHRFLSKSRNLLNFRIMFRDKQTHTRKHYALLDDPASAIVMLDSPAAAADTRRESPPLGCVGSADGLLLFEDNTKSLNKKRLTLWNPSTGKSKRLPQFVPDKDFSGAGVDCNYGLGFDESSHQFKVVVCLYHPRYPYTVMVNIYGLKDKGPWRRIENHTGFTLFRDHFTSASSSVCANGKIHWIVKSMLREHETPYQAGWEIAHLDLETEEYGILERPEFVPKVCKYASLACSQGILYVCCQHQTFRSAADVWMIIDNSTWTRVVRVPLRVLRLNPNPKVLLLHVWSDGPQVLLLCDSKFVIFNKKDSSFTYPDIANAFCKPFTYVESLISP